MISEKIRKSGWYVSDSPVMSSQARTASSLVPRVANMTARRRELIPPEGRRSPLKRKAGQISTFHVWNSGRQVKGLYSLEKVVSSSGELLLHLCVGRAWVRALINTNTSLNQPYHLSDEIDFSSERSTDSYVDRPRPSQRRRGVRHGPAACSEPRTTVLR